MANGQQNLNLDVAVVCQMVTILNTTTVLIMTILIIFNTGDIHITKNWLYL